ncbi:hypothetical protein DRN46_05200 [Thermococci archaeon]|nr:MAG: hypothetical protein DRN46_05200 [Thermococci archaeon]
MLDEHRARWRAFKKGMSVAFLGLIIAMIGANTPLMWMGFLIMFTSPFVTKKSLEKELGRVKRQRG